MDHSLFYKTSLKNLHLQVNNKHLVRLSLGKMGVGGGGGNDFVRLPVISWKSVAMYSEEHFCVRALLWIIKIG